MKHYYLIRMLGATRLPYAGNADDIMETEDFREYVATHGYHFTDTLAEYASSQLKNADGTAHRWSVAQANAALHPSNSVTAGDVCYLANMLYADYFPNAAQSEQQVLKMAENMLADPDGYEGMYFLRWIADLIGKGENVDWTDYI